MKKEPVHIVNLVKLVKLLKLLKVGAQSHSQPSATSEHNKKELLLELNMDEVRGFSALHSNMGNFLAELRLNRGMRSSFEGIYVALGSVCGAHDSWGSGQQNLRWWQSRSRGRL